MFYDDQKGAAPSCILHGQQTTEPEWKQLCHSPCGMLGKSLVKQFSGDGVSKLSFLISCIPHQGMLSKQFLAPHIIQSREPAVWGFCLGLFHFGGKCFCVETTHFRNKSEKQWSSRQLAIAELNRSTPTSKRKLWHTIAAGQGCSHLLIFL